jgi:hypothetical protein
MIEELKKRLIELEGLEKQAWANLNFVLGAKEEAQRLLKKMEEDEQKSIGDSKV